MAETARRLNNTRTASHTPEEMLQAIVAGALYAIPHVSAASITLLDHAGVITTHAPSDELVAAVDQVQVELREGPCLDALDEDHFDMTHAGNLAADPPWPHFAARALEAGFYEVLSFQLVANGAAGALNLYSGAPHRLDAQDELVGALFADQAAVALAGARRVGQLNQALETRDLIGRAKGIIIERFGVTDQQAFEMLVESSQHTNMKLVAVAELGPWHRTPRLRRARSAREDVVRACPSPAGVPASRRGPRSCRRSTGRSYSEGPRHLRVVPAELDGPGRR